MSTDKLLPDFQSWYQAQCDGRWEDDFGITIQTLDNPGWSLSIDLSETWLANREFVAIKQEESEEKWIHCWVENEKFLAACGPRFLEQAISTFLEWAQTVPEWLSVPPNLPNSLDVKFREQSDWLKLSQESQAEKCARDGCDRSRIQFSVLCRKHHYEQLKKKAPPRTASQIWVYGAADKLQEAQALIVDSVRNTSGDSAITVDDQSNSVTLSIQLSKSAIEFQLLEDSSGGSLQFISTNPSSRLNELLVKLFLEDFVKPACNTVGGVDFALNIFKGEQ